MPRFAFPLLLSLSILAGCVTTGDQAQGITPERMASTAKVAAYVGTSLYLKKHPEDAPKFRTVALALEGLLSTENFDPASLHAALGSLPIKELKSDNAAILIGAAEILWQDYQIHIDIDQAAKVKPVIEGIRDGLNLGLEVTQPAPENTP